MLSRTKLKERTRRKTNPYLVETIRLALKNENWTSIAKILSGATRNHESVNLSQIEEKTKLGDTVLIPGKVLSEGNITKKIRICALAISSPARNKLKESKSEFATIIEEIRKNPRAEGIKLI